MANIDIYSIDTNGGPIFEKPNITKRKPYSKDTNHKAASIEGATAIIDSVFDDIKNLTEDIEVLKGELGTLSDYWNDCIELENKKLEYVPMEDLNNSIEELYEKISKMFNLNEINFDNDILITNIRHKNIISNALENVKMANEALNLNMPIDIITIYIKDVLEDLGEITGEVVTEDIINEIFAKFCLGK